MTDNSFTSKIQKAESTGRIIELIDVMKKIKSDPTTIKKNANSMTDNNCGRVKF